MAKRKKTVNKKFYSIIGFLIVLMIFSGSIFFNNTLQKSSYTPVTQQTKITPTNLSPKITDIDKNTKKIILPEYKISFQIPTQFLNQIPYHEYENSIDIFLTSPDRKDKENGQTISGVAGIISIYKGWDGFSNERPENKQYWSEFIVDNSFLPIDNPLITSKTTRGYKPGFVVFTKEVKLETKSLIGYDSRFMTSCNDASGSRCSQIENIILTTLKIEQ